MRSLLAMCKLFAFALNCLWVIPTQSLVLLVTKGPSSFIFPRWWHWFACRIFNLRIRVIGTPHTNGQTLFMSNHLSYMDIPAIGSVVKASFVSKSDVANWPLFGYLATLQQTAFIQRKRTEAGKQASSLQERINHGDNLVIFPEGTSTSGLDVLPFKSSLFALALTEEAKGLYIQPVTIRIIEVDGRAPQDKKDQDHYAWPREMEMELQDHLWRFAKSKGATLQITFHPAIKAAEYEDRKVLAKTCHDFVSRGLETSLAA